MDKNEATWRAITALRLAGDLEAAKALEVDSKITGHCQYCQKRLQGSFEQITLLDTCENCWLVEGVHPAALKAKLAAAQKLYDSACSTEPADSPAPEPAQPGGGV